MGILLALYDPGGIDSSARFDGVAHELSDRFCDLRGRAGQKPWEESTQRTARDDLVCEVLVEALEINGGNADNGRWSKNLRSGNWS